MYQVRNENRRLPIKINSNTSLYDACKAIENQHGGIILSQVGLVAFWCSYYKAVKAGFQATQTEKRQLSDLGYLMTHIDNVN